MNCHTNYYCHSLLPIQTGAYGERQIGSEELNQTYFQQLLPQCLQFEDICYFHLNFEMMKKDVFLSIFWMKKSKFHQLTILLAVPENFGLLVVTICYYNFQVQMFFLSVNNQQGNFF